MNKYLKNWFTTLWFIVSYLLLTRKWISLKSFYDNKISQYLLWDKIRSSKYFSQSGCRNILTVQECKLLGQIDDESQNYIQTIPCAFIYEDRVFSGVLTNPLILNRLRNEFSFRVDDILVMSSPKSGTTWVQLIVQLIMAEGRLSKSSTIDEIFPRIERSGFTSTIFGPDRLEYLDNLKSPRLLSTHLTTKFLNEPLKRGDCKVIYVVRNPKDTIVSAYHFQKMTKFGGNLNDWSSFFDLFLKRKLVLSDWFEHVREALDWKKKNQDKMLIISYEEMIVDLPKMIKLIAKFINRPLTEDLQDKIIDKCSFSKMRSNKCVNREKEDCNDYKIAFDFSKMKFMRKGVIGDHMNLFTLNQNRRIENILAEKTTGINIRFAYTEMEAKEIVAKYGRIINV